MWFILKIKFPSCDKSETVWSYTRYTRKVFEMILPPQQQYVIADLTPLCIHQWKWKIPTCVRTDYTDMHRHVNPLTPKYPYSERTAPLTSKRCILYIYSTNISTEYFKRGIYSPLFSLQNAVCFIILTYLVPVLFTFYIQRVLKLKK